MLLHSIIDQPLPEMGAVNPLGDPRIVGVGDQDREAEIVQHALDRALPVTLLRPHLDEFADERQGVFRDPASPAQRCTQIEHAPRYVRPPLPQRIQLSGRFVMLRLQLMEFDVALGKRVLHLDVLSFR